MSDKSPGNIPLRLLSAALSEPVVTAYKVGGFGLVLIYIGTLFTLLAFFFGPSIFGYSVLAVGVLIVLVIVLFFYFQFIRPLQYTQAQIEKNKEIVDTVQKSAIHMADLASDLHELTIRHVGEVTDLIVQYQEIAEDIIPFVQQLAQQLKIPGAHKIGTIVDNKYVLKEKDLAASILLTTHGTEEVIGKIRLALYQSDLEPLKEYQGQLKELDQKLRELLKTIDNPQSKDQSD